MKTYLVGGAVRDELLGLPVQERDYVVVGAEPQAMLDAGFKPVGKDFPVFLHPTTHEEYALARTERNTSPGYHGFEFYAAPDVTLEQDLLRRDLTINAMARDSDGTLIDPYNGHADLQSRTLRHVSEAFAEDPVRVLRLARFAARLAPLGFTVAEKTLDLMREMVNQGELDALVPERVWQELDKTLSKADQASVFFLVLRECGALKVLFPELDRLFGVPQKPEWHPEVDTGVHTMMVLDQACKMSAERSVRFAALCHDLGKGLTPADILPSHRGHEAVSARLSKDLCERLRIPNECRELAMLVAEYHTHCHRAFELKAATVLKTLYKLDAFRRPQRLADFLLCCEADARGRTGFEDAPYPQRGYFQGAFEAAARVSARDIAAAGGKGAEIRERLDAARREAIRSYKAANAG